VEISNLKKVIEICKMLTYFNVRASRFEKVTKFTNNEYFLGNYQDP